MTQEINDLIRRSLKAKASTRIGTVMTTPVMFNMDNSAGGAPVWVVDVEIGSNRLLKNIPVKSGSDRSIEYAKRGMAVKLERTAYGRWVVVGPGDRVTAPLVIKHYDINTKVASSTVSRGFSVFRPGIDYYQGLIHMVGAPTLTFDQVPAANDTISRDVGSWLDDGFLNGQVIRVASTINNNGTLTIAIDPTDLVLEFTGDVLTDEVATQVSVAVDGASFWTSASFPFSQVRDQDGTPV